MRGVGAAVYRPASSLRFATLPQASRAESGDARGGAQTLGAAAFNADDFVTGTVRLGPGSSKRKELCVPRTMSYYVARCQPRALQVRIWQHAFPYAHRLRLMQMPYVAARAAGGYLR